MKKYKRQYGDSLLSRDCRLKYTWKWNRCASGVSKQQLKEWAYFQTSKCVIGSWRLEATQWGDGDTTTYEANVQHIGDYIVRKSGFKTRIDAQIGAEKLFLNWIEEQYKRYVLRNG